MRRDPARLAWTVVLVSFSVFITLAVALPVGIRRWVTHSTDVQPTSLEVGAGTVLVDGRGFSVPTKPIPPVLEGSTIQTDENSRALLTLFDGSQITVFPDSTLRLVSVRSRTFTWSPLPNVVVLSQTAGRIRVRADSSGERPTAWEVKTPQATASFGEGNYAVVVSNELSEVAVRSGSAEVHAADQTVTLDAGFRAVTALESPPQGPLPAPRNLIVNGDFSQGLEGWEERNILPQIPPGELEVLSLGERVAVRFRRDSGTQIHSEAGIVQQLDLDVSDFQSLVVRLDVRIDFHDLSGGGAQASEYPVIIRLLYEDQFGSVTEWYRGFYYQNTTGNLTVNGEAVERARWTPFEVDLIAARPELPPTFLRSLEIYASGWNYIGFVSEVGIWVE